MYICCLFVVSHEQNNRKRKNMCKEFFMTLSRLFQLPVLRKEQCNILRKFFRRNIPYNITILRRIRDTYIFYFCYYRFPPFLVEMKYPQDYNEMRLIT